MKFQTPFLAFLLLFNVSQSFAALTCTTTTLPGGNDFEGISGTSDYNVIAVGLNGNIFIFDGTSWTQMSSPTVRALRDIFLLPDGTGFAVGDHGTILSFNGTIWSSVTSTEVHDIDGIWALSATEAYAVGKNATLLRYDGTAWVDVAAAVPGLNPSDNLVKVWGTSALVYVLSQRGELFIFNRSAGTWSNTTLCDAASSDDFKDLWIDASGNVILSGKNGSIYLYNGSSCSSVATATHELNGIYGSTSTGQIYSAGNNGVVMYYNGTSWQELAQGTEDLKDVWLSSTGSVYYSGKNAAMTVCSSEVLTGLAAWWQMDEATWNGTANEVVDQQPGSYHGRAVNGAFTDITTPAISGNPGTCRYGVFDGTNDYIELPGFPNLNTDFTITAWINPTRIDKDQRIFVDDAGNSGGFAFSLGDNSNGQLRLFSRNINPVSLDSPTVITTGSWQFVTAVHDAAAKVRRIYVDGVLQVQDSPAYTGTWGTDPGLAAIGGEVDGNSESTTNWRFDGSIDEARVYTRVLSAAEINQVMLQTHPCISSGHFAISHDGSADNCSAERITITKHNDLHGTETTYTGTINLTTSTGHGDWSVITGTPAGLVNSGGGSGSYTFDGSESGVVVLGLLNTFSESLNINVTDGTASEDPAEDNDLVFSGSLSETFADNFDLRAYTNNDGSANWATNWLEISENDGPTNGDEQVVTDLGNNYSLQVKDNDGSGEGVQREADLSLFTTAILSFDYRRNGLDGASDYVAVYASGDGGGSWTELPGGRFAGPGNDAAYQSFSYDISLYIAANTRIRFLSSSTLSNNDIVYFDNIEIAASAPPVCAGVDHYEILHDGNGINCQAEPVTFSAHDSAHGVIAAHTGLITLSTSTGHGDWSVISGNPANLVNSGDGDGTYTFDGTESGAVVLGLKDTFVENTNINVTDGSATELTGSAQAAEDADLAFAEAGFNFLAGGVINAIGNQIGGKASNIAPGNQTLELEAIRTSDDTGQCEAALVNANTIDLAFECINPPTCTANLVNINGTDIAANNSGAVASYTGVSLDFGNNTDTTATFILTYPEVGQLQLHARYDIPFGSGPPSGNLMVGTGNNFVARPFGFDVSAAGNPGATTAAGNLYTAAGTLFQADVRAVLWQAADDTDNDGVPDNHGDTDPANNADLADNTAALNFGQETTSEDVTLSSLLFLPGGGNDPALAGTPTVTGFTNGTSSGNVRYDEVGIIELIANLTDNNYLGAGSVTGRSGHVGRFSPADFNVSLAPDPPTLADSCLVGGYTYLGQPLNFTVNPVLTITARNSVGATTRNYDCGSFWKLPDPYTLNYTFADSSGAGPALTPANGTASPAAGETTDCNGSISVTVADSLSYARPAVTAPVQPFAAAIDLAADPAQFTDSDGVCFGAGCLPFTRAGITGANLRHGRSTAGNAYGPETATAANPLVMPIAVEYYDSSPAWVTNTSDSCTGFTYLITPNGTITVTGSPVSPITTSSGIGNLSLWPTADPAPAGGSVDLNYDFPLWLDDLAVEAFFGIYRGNDRIINWREIVR
ncbi:MAG: LamG domain-containing protein [Proteobacteria bacterium]|nr:LamG domain-containing protein [Pseudomonadota bacterium]MBU1738680.1 LamG domain-containing protein [Pseudomonadota bacterium]